MGEGGGRGRVWGVRVKSFWENSPKKKSGGWGSVWQGVRVDVNGELKFLCKYKKKYKKNLGGGGGGGGVGGGRVWGVRMDVNEELKFL